tara:strand:+ start:4289 stop:4723 length:435 start_codon:yes stop_codon:yes gene_type:complete
MPQTTETGDRYQGAGVSWGAILARTARVPRVFLDDHVERDLPCPPIRRETKRHYWVCVDHPDASELLNDAAHYADPYGRPDGEEYNGLVASARATKQALLAAKVTGLADDWTRERPACARKDLRTALAISVEVDKQNAPAEGTD